MGLLIGIPLFLMHSLLYEHPLATFSLMVGFFVITVTLIVTRFQSQYLLDLHNTLFNRPNWDGRRETRKAIWMVIGISCAYLFLPRLIFLISLLFVSLADSLRSKAGLLCHPGIIPAHAAIVYSLMNLHSASGVLFSLTCGLVGYLGEVAETTSSIDGHFGVSVLSGIWLCLVFGLFGIDPGEIKTVESLL